MSGYGRACLGVILVFALGCLCGGLGTSVYDHHRTTVLFQKGSAAYLEALQARLTDNLNLDADQKQQVYRIMVDNLSKRKRIQNRIQPALQMVNYQLISQVQSVLRPDQLQLFRQNLGKVHRYSTFSGAPMPAPPPAPAATNAAPAGSASASSAPGP
jgi:hypothetical protein